MKTFTRFLRANYANDFKRCKQRNNSKDGKETKTCRVVKGLSEVSETIRPLGNYSMCPLLRA